MTKFSNNIQLLRVANPKKRGKTSTLHNSNITAETLLKLGAKKWEVITVILYNLYDTDSIQNTLNKINSLAQKWKPERGHNKFVMPVMAWKRGNVKYDMLLVWVLISREQQLEEQKQNKRNKKTTNGQVKLLHFRFPRLCKFKTFKMLKVWWFRLAQKEIWN